MIYNVGTIFKNEKERHLSVVSLSVDDTSTTPTIMIGYKTWKSHYDQLTFDPVDFDTFLQVLESDGYLATLYVNDRLYQIVNADDKDYNNHCYLVSLAQIVTPMAVYADCGGDAIDELADYALDQGWLGYFLDDSDLADYDDDDVCHVGNYGKPVLSHEIYCQAV